MINVLYIILHVQDLLCGQKSAPTCSVTNLLLAHTRPSISDTVNIHHLMFALYFDMREGFTSNLVISHTTVTCLSH